MPILERHKKWRKGCLGYESVIVNICPVAIQCVDGISRHPAVAPQLLQLDPDRVLFLRGKS